MSLDLTASERRALSVLALILGLALLGWILFEPQTKPNSPESENSGTKHP